MDKPMEKENEIHLVYPPVLNIVNYLVGIMTSSWSLQESATTLMDIINNFRRQFNGIFGVEPSISSLKIFNLWSKLIWKLARSCIAIYTWFFRNNITLLMLETWVENFKDSGG